MNLPAEDWKKQSACDECLVSDVVAHLVGNSEFYASTVTQGLEDKFSPPEGRPEAWTGHLPISAGALAKSSIAARERLGGKGLGTFIEKDNHLIDLLTGLSLEDQVKPCYHPGSIVPGGNFVDVRFKELVLHQWDIWSAVEEKVVLSAHSLESMVILIRETFTSGSLRWAFWAGPALDRPVRYRFDVKTPVPVTADIIVEGDRFRYEQVPQGVADVTFRCRTHLFALLMYGRMKAAEAMAAGHLTIEGDKALAEQFSQWFKGISPECSNLGCRLAVGRWTDHLVRLFKEAERGRLGPTLAVRRTPPRLVGESFMEPIQSRTTPETRVGSDNPSKAGQ